MGSYGFLSVGAVLSFGLRPGAWVLAGSHAKFGVFGKDAGRCTGWSCAQNKERLRHSTQCPDGASAGTAGCPVEWQYARLLDVAVRTEGRFGFGGTIRRVEAQSRRCGAWRAANSVGPFKWGDWAPL